MDYQSVSGIEKVADNYCVDDINDVSVLKRILLNEENSIRVKRRCLFQLRKVGTLDAIHSLEEALIKEKTSDFIRHEICYILGQMPTTEENIAEIQQFLNKEVFEDPNIYNSIVLHEAAEALGNINSENNMKLLENFLNYEDQIIKETCELSVENINWMQKTNNGQTEGLDKLNLIYHTNDPAPPFNFNDKDIESVRSVMHDEKESLFNRYRAIFTLRELNNDKAVEILCECYDKKYKQKFSPLFKHEVSSILGQMWLQAKGALKQLEISLQDEEEDPIVRHESALALGAITESKDLLLKYLRHENQLLAESCDVALGLIEMKKII